MSENNMPDNTLKVLTGLSWKNVTELRQLLTSMRNTDTRTISQALIVFLFKARTGNSNKVIASVLGLLYEQRVSTFSNEILKSFEKDILPFFGLISISPEDLISNTISIARRLLNLTEGQLLLIFDGTNGAKFVKCTNLKTFCLRFP